MDTFGAYGSRADAAYLDAVPAKEVMSEEVVTVTPDEGAGTVTVALTGTVAPSTSAELAASPPTLAFRALPRGVFEELFVRITNTGSGPADLSQVAVTGAADI